MRKLLLAGMLLISTSAAHAEQCWGWTPNPELCEKTPAKVVPVKEEEPGFWFGHRYCWPERNYYYDDWTHANYTLDRSEPTVADLPSWLRHKPVYKHLRRR